MAKKFAQHPLGSEGEIIGILHNEPLAAGTPGWEASRDVLVQAEAIADAVKDLGHQAVMLPFSGEPQALCESLHHDRVTKVFNLCESINEDPSLIGHPAALLELLNLPFTGSSAFALMLSTDKLAGKLLLQGAGIRTPRFLLYESPDSLDAFDLLYPVIAKPRFEDASIGIDQESIFSSREEMAHGAERLSTQHGPLLIEEYIAGREINVALLGAPKLQVLALAEIDFSAFPDGLYPIVGYRAKWEEDSFEYRNTPRLFPDDLPPSAVTALHQVALRCCRIFQLRDYGRVDIRLDKALTAHVLEVNANPCLSPDAGFCAAALNQGIDFKGLIRRLIACMDTR